MSISPVNWTVVVGSNTTMGNAVNWSIDVNWTTMDEDGNDSSFQSVGDAKDMLPIGVKEIQFYTSIGNVHRLFRKDIEKFRFKIGFSNEGFDNFDNLYTIDVWLKENLSVEYIDVKEVVSYRLIFECATLAVSVSMVKTAAACLKDNRLFIEHLGAVTKTALPEVEQK